MKKRDKIFIGFNVGLLTVAIGLIPCVISSKSHPYNPPFSDQREMDGTVLDVTEKFTKIVTDDGNVWQIENFPCLVGTRCTVTFSTQKTDDPIDDVITDITTYTSFN